MQERELLIAGLLTVLQTRECGGPGAQRGRPGPGADKLLGRRGLMLIAAEGRGGRRPRGCWGGAAFPGVAPMKRPSRSTSSFPADGLSRSLIKALPAPH